MISTVLATLTLSLVMLALVLPQGAAADEKEDSRGGVRRVEPAATAVVAQIAAGESDEGDDAGQAVVILDEAVPPDPPGCPEGFVLASPPLNPALGCIANNLATSTGGATVVIAAGTDTADNPDPFCPPGFEPALPPLNPALGCINTTIGTGSASGGGSAQIVYVGSGGRVEHPGHCAEGYSYRLVLRENADGSLTWLYTCVPDGAGPGGPDDITSGDGGRRRVIGVGGLKFEVDMIE